MHSLLTHAAACIAMFSGHFVNGSEPAKTEARLLARDLLIDPSYTHDDGWHEVSDDEAKKRPDLRNVVKMFGSDVTILLDRKLPGQPLIGLSAKGEITDARLKAVASFDKLRQIVMFGDDLSVASLTKVKELNQLTSLSFLGPRVTADDLKKMSNLKQLRALVLTDADLTEELFDVLKDFDQLESLQLSDWSAKLAAPDGMPQLALLRKLKGLSFTYTKLSDNAVKDLLALLT